MPYTERKRRYEQTAKGKARQKKYSGTKKGKARYDKYSKSKKGKARDKKYRATPYGSYARTVQKRFKRAGVLKKEIKKWLENGWVTEEQFLWMTR